MNKVFLSLLLLFFGIGSILVMQAMKTTTSVVYLPSELAELSSDQQISRVRVAGRVSAEEFDYQVEPVIRLAFSITDPEEKDSKGKVSKANSDAVEREKTVTIPVLYNKLMPDMFAPGRDVIINGSFEKGILKAKNLMTQCPSKYEPPKITTSDKTPVSKSAPEHLGSLGN